MRWLDIHVFGGRGRLVRHYFLISVILVGGGLIMSGLAEVYFRYRESRHHLALLHREVAAGAAFKIERFIQEIENVMKATTKSLEITRKGLSGEYSSELAKLLSIAPAIDEAVAIGANGMIRAQLSRFRTIRAEVDQDLSKAVTFREAEQGKSYFSPVHFVRGSEPYMTIAVPIERFAGKVIGVLQAEVNLKYIWRVVSGIKVGKAGYVYVVSRSGDLVAHSDLSLVLQRHNMAQLNQVKDAFRLATEVPDAGGAVARNLFGKKVFSSYVLIPSLNWAVFVDLPMEEAYEPLYASMLLTSGLLLIALSMALLASLFLARRVVRPLQALRRGVERIGRGDWDFRVELKTGDEIELVAEEFNKMTAALQEAYTDLERKVADRTAELMVANERLKELDNMKSDFVSNVSHELRTPLTSIKASADNMLDGLTGHLSEKQIRYLSRIKSNTDRLARLINDLLDLSRIEAGGIELKPANLPLVTLIREVTESLRPMAAEKLISLEVASPENNVNVWADRDKVTQVLMNLVGNAVKFTPPHGKVTVAIERNGDEWLQISVTDTGPGIPREEANKIFDKFYQIAQMGKQKPKGTGLGLAISKALVEMHRGKIWMESEVGRGSIFSFSLPAQKLFKLETSTR